MIHHVIGEYDVRRFPQRLAYSETVYEIHFDVLLAYSTNLLLESTSQGIVNQL